VNVPPGGYYFGNGQTNKSTEHNIDVYALFTMLAKLTGNGSWLDGAQHAKAFVEAMFDSPSGHFWTGTSDATHIFYNNSPEDVQSWSYLAFQDQILRRLSIGSKPIWQLPIQPLLSTTAGARTEA